MDLDGLLPNIYSGPLSCLLSENRNGPQTRRAPRETRKDVHLSIQLDTTNPQAGGNARPPCPWPSLIQASLPFVATSCRAVLVTISTLIGKYFLINQPKFHQHYKQVKKKKHKNLELKKPQSLMAQEVCFKDEGRGKPGENEVLAREYEST